MDDATEGSEGGLSIDHNDEDDEIEAHNKVVASASPDSHMDEADESNANENVAENSKAATLLQEVSSSQEDCKSEVLSSVMRMSSTPANDAQTTTVSTTVSPVARNTPSASVKAVTTVSPKCETRPSLTSTSALSGSSSSTSSSTNHQRSRKSKNRRFGIRKPPSRLKRKEVAKLREMSMRLGGAQYFKKRVNETAQCEKCGVITTSRMSDHAYRHMDAQLFLCPHCDNGSQSRELVVRHMRDMHNSTEHPIDDRLKYAAEIKEMIRQCYPAFFIDAPIPTAADIEKLKASLAMNGSCKEEVDGGQEDDGNEAEADEAEHDTEESGDEGDDSGLHDDDETGHDEEDGMKDDQMDDDQNGTVEAEELDVKNTTPSSKTASRREDEEEIEAEM
ncbi:unnamed protein product [Anisakis simplex]|uniref:C2H2-type domain-containing protein n=1 Tax=Anisakis simplex TaxID=6269 RepID=A0A3P6RSH0_ANISI|nr:unnamed protein product [Anisakis simplex]